MAQTLAISYLSLRSIPLAGEGVLGIGHVTMAIDAFRHQVEYLVAISPEDASRGVGLLLAVTNAKNMLNKRKVTVQSITPVLNEMASIANEVSHDGLERIRRNHAELLKKIRIDAFLADLARHFVEAATS